MATVTMYRTCNPTERSSDQTVYKIVTDYMKKGYQIVGERLNAAGNGHVYVMYSPASYQTVVIE